MLNFAHMTENTIAEIRNAISKQRDLKTKEDIAYIKELLSLHTLFFKNFTEVYKIEEPEVVDNICRSLEYKRSDIYDVILEQGDTDCKYFYVVLSGKLSILMTQNFNSIENYTE